MSFWSEIKELVGFAPEDAEGGKGYSGMFADASCRHITKSSGSGNSALSNFFGCFFIIGLITALIVFLIIIGRNDKRSVEDIEFSRIEREERAEEKQRQYNRDLNNAHYFDAIEHQNKNNH